MDRGALGGDNMVSYCDSFRFDSIHSVLSVRLHSDSSVIFVCAVRHFRRLRQKRKLDEILRRISPNIVGL